jgi:hypothetical protein
MILPQQLAFLEIVGAYDDFIGAKWLMGLGSIKSPLETSCGLKVNTSI